MIYQPPNNVLETIQNILTTTYCSNSLSPQNILETT